jgi:NitT/TauT family transport system substrate-binding protein
MEPFHRMVLAAWVGIATLGAVNVAPPIATAEAIKIGVLKNGGAAGGLFIAADKGYFAAEGLTPEFVFFDAGSPIAVATLSGSLDFGYMGGDAATYNLAGQGALKIIGATSHLAPTFRVFAAVVSNRAYESGLKSVKDLAGHAVAVATVGGAQNYSLVLLEEKYGVDAKSIRLMALQSNANILSALKGGQDTDAAIVQATAALPALDRGDIRLLAYVDDEVPWQNGIAVTATKTITEQPNKVERFLRAAQKGRRDYHDAFTDPSGQRKDQPTAPEVLAVISKYIGQSPAQIARSIAYVDPEGRLDVNDIQHQIAWYKSQGMVKGDFDPKSVMDVHYVVPLPEK